MRPGLKELQGWFQHEIVRHVDQRAARGRVRERILPSKSLKPEERVGIYSTMYRLRMLEALEVDYPALRRFLGREGFEKLMLAYLKKHPSKHYSLNFLGYALPEFLDGPVKLPHRAFLADVARVEHLITVVFDEQPSPKLDPRALASLAPEAWSGAKLELARALRLVELDHDAQQAVTALRHDKEAPTTRKQSTWLVVYRKDGVVWRMALERAAYEILRALQVGKTLPKAIEAGARVFEGDPGQLQSKLQGWFAEWTAEGLFRALKA